MSYGLMLATAMVQEAGDLAEIVSGGNGHGETAPRGRPAGAAGRSFVCAVGWITHVSFSPDKRICVVLD